MLHFCRQRKCFTKKFIFKCDILAGKENALLKKLQKETFLTSGFFVYFFFIN
jgi:hypothetical protein